MLHKHAARRPEIAPKKHRVKIDSSGGGKISATLGVVSSWNYCTTFVLLVYLVKTMRYLW